MMIHKIEDNDVNETGYEGLSSGSDGVPGQAPLGRQPATGRRKSNNVVNRVVMECYFESEPTVRGYRKRMLSAWQKREMFKVSEQNLADQARANKWLSEVELEEISGKEEAPSEIRTVKLRILLSRVTSLLKIHRDEKVVGLVLGYSES